MPAAVKVLTLGSVLALGLALVSVLAIQPASAQRNRGEPPPPPLEAVHVQGNVYSIPGAGGNVTVQIGRDGVLVVDTGLLETGDRIVAAIRALTDKPIRNIVNTHVHPDHAGGNTAVAAAGQFVGFRQVIAGDTSTPIYAHENVLHRMVDEGEDVWPSAAWPTETYFTESFDMFFNGESIQLLHQPAAHTDGDSIVYFRRSDVISTGDIFVTTSYPFIDAARGGTLQGIIDGLNSIVDLMIPDANEEGGTLAVSGHGRIVDEYEVVAYRDMLVIVRDRIAAMIEMGMSVEQTKAARPSRDYDGRYGLDSDFWSTEQFIETVYRELAE